jgi:hypothetical protein
MPHYLNNCANRDHKAIYGPDVFYDLNTWGSQAENQFLFRPGEFCVVASQPAPDMIRFAWYKFTDSRLMSDEKQQQVRVLCGSFVKEESMAKADAVIAKYYFPFFDKNGNFKRQSVI